MNDDRGSSSTPEDSRRTVRASLVFHVPDEAWSDVTEGPAQREYPRSRLFTSVVFNGVDFHAEALEVTQGHWGVLQTVDPAWESSLTEYYLACGADGVLSTWRIAGKEYAVFFTPSAR